MFKLKDNMKDMRETVAGQVQNLTEKAGIQLNKLMEKAKEMKGQAQKEFQKKVEMLKGKFEQLVQQYEKSLEDAVSMRKDAEDTLKKVMEQMSSGSQDLFEKAKKLATDNIEIAKGYMEKLQDTFTQQLEKFTWEVRFA